MTAPRRLSRAGRAARARGSEFWDSETKNITRGRPTVNLFLYAVKENRALHDQVPHAEFAAGLFARDSRRAGGLPLTRHRGYQSIGTTSKIAEEAPAARPGPAGLSSFGRFR